ncbi:hypothetical protein COU58_01070, partial [Candidatus Pacearchaeota archaeon CG10_big_fil_rev_8_21_14_0_10_32_42]
MKRLKNLIFVLGIFLIVFLLLMSLNNVNAQGTYECISIPESSSCDLKHDYCHTCYRPDPVCSTIPFSQCDNEGVPRPCQPFSGGSCGTLSCPPDDCPTDAEHPNMIYDYLDTCSGTCQGDGSCECNIQQCVVPGGIVECNQNTECDLNNNYECSAGQTRYTCAFREIDDWSDSRVDYIWKLKDDIPLFSENASLDYPWSPNHSWCGDGHDNDCDGQTDCLDSDCVDDPLCSDPPSECTLTFAQIYAYCSPYGCAENDVVQMFGSFVGNCFDYPNLFFQISAQDHWGDPTCRINYTSGNIKGIDSDSLFFGGNRKVYGSWTIPAIPDFCRGINVSAVEANFYDDDPDIGGKLITHTNSATGKINFSAMGLSPPFDCVLNSASWSETSVDNGTEVVLELNGANCALNDPITFVIYESDGGEGFDDYVKTIDGVFSGTTWTAIWIQGDDGNDEPRDYYFRAIVPGSGGIGVQSNLLSVSKISGNVPDYCFGPPPITRCGDYLNFGNCTGDTCIVADDTGPDFNVECGGVIDCFCFWNDAPAGCKFGYSDNGGGYGSPVVGTCEFTETTNDDCSDGFLSYSYTGNWIWAGRGFLEQGGCNAQEICGSDPNCCTQRNNQGYWYYDPQKLNERCQDGQKTVECSSLSRLPFFGLYSFIISLVL